jgi:hypothetical protein
VQAVLPVIEGMQDRAAMKLIAYLCFLMKAIITAALNFIGRQLRAAQSHPVE